MIGYGYGERAAEAQNRFWLHDRLAFLDDLRTAKGDIAATGFSLMTKTLHPGKPPQTRPKVGQFEKIPNGHWLVTIGYGAACDTVKHATIEKLLANLALFRRQLASFLRDAGAAVKTRLSQ